MPCLWCCLIEVKRACVLQVPSRCGEINSTRELVKNVMLLSVSKGARDWTVREKCQFIIKRQVQQK